MQTQSSQLLPSNTTPMFKLLPQPIKRFLQRHIGLWLLVLSVTLSLFGCASPPRPQATPGAQMVAPDPALMTQRDYRAEWDKKLQGKTSDPSPTSSLTTPQTK